MLEASASTKRNVNFSSSEMVTGSLRGSSSSGSTNVMLHGVFNVVKIASEPNKSSLIAVARLRKVLEIFVSVDVVTTLTARGGFMSQSFLMWLDVQFQVTVPCS